MAKKRYALYISRPLASKFDLVAQQRHGSKSAMLEEALRLSLEPQRVPGAEEVLVRRLDELHKVVGTVNRDVAIVTETLALFVRYFLTITPPLPQSEQEPARLLGRERFQVFVAQVGRRLATDHRLVSEVLETIARNNPDLFATTADDAPLHARAAGNGNGAHREVACRDGAHRLQEGHRSWLISCRFMRARKHRAAAARCCAPPLARRSPPP